jgi:hypothetical protein
MEANMVGVRKTFVILLMAAFLFIPFATSAIAAPTKYPPKPNSAVMAADFFVVRPIGIASLIIGTVSFVLSSPFSALGDNLDQAYELMVVEPAVYTFKRPLGGF